MPTVGTAAILVVQMRYLRTSGLRLLDALRPIADTLDMCWWYIGGQGFTMTRQFVEGLQPLGLSEQELHDHWIQLLTDYVDHDTPIGRVGKPGFFTRLGNSLDLNWACYFAIEGDEMPLPSLHVVAKHDRDWFGPVDDLPSDMVLVARDLDFGYQDYGFRDEWMFLAVLDHLGSMGYRADEVTEWPPEGNASVTGG